MTHFKSQIPELINSIIENNTLKVKLEEINNLFSNLKQENDIRDYFLQCLNNDLAPHKMRAFAEHPRINKRRVDLSIISKSDIDNPYKIEFKFNFTGDLKRWNNYYDIIEQDFKKRGSDMFILIVANWDKESKRKYDKSWGITSDLSRYIAKNDDWKGTLLNSFKKFKNAELQVFNDIQIGKPYEVDYHFYVLRKK